MRVGAGAINHFGRGRFDISNRGAGQKASPSLYRSPVSSQIAINPQGQQHLSLFSHSGKALSSKLMIPDHQKNAGGSVSSRVKKVAVVAEKGRKVIGEVSHLTLLGMRMAKMGHLITKGTKEIPDDAFNSSFRAFESINIAGQSIAFIKSTGETIYGAVRDAAAHGKRGEAQSLLESFNAETRQFDSGIASREQRAKLRRLMSEKKSDLSRSKTQIAIDRLTQIAGNTEQAGKIAHSAMFIAESSSKLAAKALPGMAIALGAMRTIQSAIKTGSQVSALNNLAKATSATKDPLLKALAGYIKQERTINARKNLVSTAVSFASTGVAIGLAASGAGAPAAFIATGAIGAAVSISETAFNAWHNRKLAKNRKQADWLMKSGRPLNALARENIGVAEKNFLAKLRHAHGNELKETVTFLRNFGLTDATIKKLQLAPEDTAIKKLRTVLYEDKVKYKGLQLKQTAKTLAHVIGLSALGKRIKAGSLWLMSRLKPDKRCSVGHSLLSGGQSTQLSKKIHYTFRQPTAPDSLQVQYYLRKRLTIKLGKRL